MASTSASGIVGGSSVLSKGKKSRILSINAPPTGATGATGAPGGTGATGGTGAPVSET